MNSARLKKPNYVFMKAIVVQRGSADVDQQGSAQLEPPTFPMARNGSLT